MKPLESSVERAFTRAAAARGALCFKFKLPGQDGWPDRMVLLPGRFPAWFELKREGERPSKLQLSNMRKLQSMGFLAQWGDSVTQIEEFFSDWDDQKVSGRDP